LNASQLYPAGSVGGVSSAPGEVRLAPLGRSRITGHGGGGNGFHPAYLLRVSSPRQPDGT
jgi:hypothetical protein